MKRRISILLALLIILGCGKVSSSGEASNAEPAAAEDAIICELEEPEEGEESAGEEEALLPRDALVKESEDEEEASKLSEEERQAVSAAKRGDVDELSDFLTAGGDVNLKDDEGNALLHLAAHECKLTVAEFLIEMGADIHTRDQYGETPLHIAIRTDGDEVVKLLLKWGANVSAKDDFGETPMHDAAWWGVPGIVKQLLEMGGDINAKDNNGKTPLDHAIGGFGKEAADFLRENGATSGTDYTTALREAVDKGDARRVRELISLGADVNKECDCWKPLPRAAFHGYKEIVELLIDLDSEGIGSKRCGESLLHRAAYSGSVETAEFLISRGAQINEKNDEGHTSLEEAQAWDRRKMVECLLRHGGKGGEPHRFGLFEALRDSDAKAVEDLLLEGASVDAKDSRNRTALYFAVDEGKLHIARLLVRNGADTKTKNTHEDYTVLHAAARNSSCVKLVQLLIDSDAQVNARNEDEKTPLHEAIYNGNTEAAIILIENGARADIPDEGGWTAAKLAEKKGYTAILEALNSRR